jgi:hypothetical protein
MLYPLSYGSTFFNDADVSMRPTAAVNRETQKEDECEELNARIVLGSATKSENKIKYE